MGKGGKESDANEARREFGAITVALMLAAVFLGPELLDMSTQTLGTGFAGPAASRSTSFDAEKAPGTRSSSSEQAPAIAVSCILHGDLLDRLASVTTISHQLASDAVQTATPAKPLQRLACISTNYPGTPMAIIAKLRSKQKSKNFCKFGRAKTATCSWGC